ncbi:MAG: class I SAM-dependent methyltransferase [Actinobacteria bacterium]|nr:class I SAM-dependent methyltransferase [Actinomycetota bacterium]
MTSEQARQIGRLFDTLAPEYDSVGVEFFGPIASSLVTALAPRAGERWLDMGCGRGAVLLRAAPVLGDRGLAVGTDISAGMLEACHDAVHRAGLTNVALHQDDAQAPSLPAVPGGFHAIASSAVVFFLPDPAAALSAWLPLAAPGGRLGITTFAELDPRWQALDRLFDPYLPVDMLDARTTGAAGPFASDDGVEELVAGAGWAEVRTVSDEVEVRFASPEHWRRFSMSTGQRRMWALVPDDERQSVVDRAFAQLSADSAADGSTTYWQRFRHTLAVRP